MNDIAKIEYNCIPAEILSYLHTLGFIQKGKDLFEVVDKRNTYKYILWVSSEGYYQLKVESPNDNGNAFKRDVFNGYTIRNLKDAEYLFTCCVILYPLLGLR